MWKTYLFQAAPSAAFCHYPTQAHSPPPYTRPACPLTSLTSSPSDLGQMVPANDVSVDSDLLVVPDGQVLLHRRCSWYQSSGCYSGGNLIPSALSQLDKTCPCGPIFKQNAMNHLQMPSEAGLLPLPGVSNAVGCGCVSDCCRLWGCGPGFREWGFL